MQVCLKLLIFTLTNVFYGIAQMAELSAKWMSCTAAVQVSKVDIPAFIYRAVSQLFRHVRQNNIAFMI